jgi:hypothetical protein
MASVNIPIVSEFDAKGTQKAIKEFKSLEGASAKAQFAIKKAAVPAAAALTAVAGAIGLATKAAVEDQAEQTQLAVTMKNVTGAADAQVAATEKMIASMSRASGTADSELRPAFASLLRGTKDVQVATTALSLAQDIAIGSNKSLGEVSEALARAYGGNMKGLQALSPEIKAMIKDGASLDEVMTVLNGTFGGAAAAAANTAAGKFKILKNSLDETKESIGAALLPVVEAALPILQKFADWAQDNPKAFLAIAAAITAISVAILAVNLAMALNPFTAIAAGVAALVVGIGYAYNKFETFRTIVNSVLNGLMKGFEIFANTWINTVNALIKGINAISPFTDIPSVPKVDLPSIGGGGGGFTGVSERAGMPETGSIVPSMPVIATPVIPTPAAPMTGGGGSSRYSGGGNTIDTQGQIGSFFGGVTPEMIQQYTVNVNGGLASSAEVGNAVVNAIRAFNRQNGPADIAVA